MKKIALTFLLSALSLFASSALDLAALSFGIEGGAEKNPVIYKMAESEESGKNQKAFFKKTILANKKNYLIAKKVLEDKGVPTSFLWVAMTESKFNNSVALKRTKTAGIWQMIPSTSRMFGLKVTKDVDERKDVEKCTAAFADYCKYMYKDLKDWGLVAVGYNCGDGRLKKVIKRVGSRDLNVLLDPNKKFLPKETRIYFARTLTLARTANHEDIELFLRELEEGDKI